MNALRHRLSRARDSGDRGQILLLAMAYGVLAILLVTVVVSASAVHLKRKQLLDLADLAAADAADSVDASGLYTRGVVTGIPLTSGSVQASARSYVSRHAVPGRFTGLAVDPATGTPDGQTAEVTLTAMVRPPLVTYVISAWSAGIPLTVTSRARADLG